MQRFMRDGMFEFDRVGVQRRARDERCCVFAAVEHITRQRQIDRGEVRTDLMRAASLRLRLDQRVLREAFEHV